MAKSLEFYIWVANDTLIGCNVQMALPTASPASLLRRGVLSRGPSLCVLAHRVVLQLGLEEELLWALRAVVNLVFLPVHSEDVLLQLVGLDEDCEAHRAFEGATHALKAVLDEVAEEFGWGVEHLVAQLTLVVDAFLNHVVGNMDLDLSLILKSHLALDALVCLSGALATSGRLSGARWSLA